MLFKVGGHVELGGRRIFHVCLVFQQCWPFFCESPRWRSILLVDRINGRNGPCGSWSGVFEKAVVGIFLRIGPELSPASETVRRRVILLMSKCVAYGGGVLLRWVCVRVWWRCDFGNVCWRPWTRVLGRGTISHLSYCLCVCLSLVAASGMWWLVGRRQRGWSSVLLLLSTVFSTWLGCWWFVPASFRALLPSCCSVGEYRDTCPHCASFQRGDQGQCRRGMAAELTSSSSVSLLRPLHTL